MYSDCAAIYARGDPRFDYTHLRLYEFDTIQQWMVLRLEVNRKSGRTKHAYLAHLRSSIAPAIRDDVGAVTRSLAASNIGISAFSRLKLISN